MGPEIPLNRAELAARMARSHPVLCLPASRAQNHLHNECYRKPEPRDPKNHQNTRQLSNRRGRHKADLPGHPQLRESRAGASENGLPHETSSLSYTQNGSTDDPSKPHGLSLIHRVSDAPQMVIRKAASTICCRGTSSRQDKLPVFPSDRLQIYPDHCILHAVVLLRFCGLNHHKCWHVDAFRGRSATISSLVGQPRDRRCILPRQRDHGNF